MLLLLSPPLLFGYAANLRVWTNPRLVDANKKLAGVVTTATADVQAYEKAVNDAEEARQKLEAMAGGVRERLNWLHLYAFIDEAIPTPDGRKLAENSRQGLPAYQRFYVEGGARALDDYKKLREKMAKGSAPSPEEMKAEEDVKKKLCQVHIEGITALYSDNLPTEYFAKLIDKTRKEKDANAVCYRLLGPDVQTYPGIPGTLAEAIRKADPTLPKAGWVVEIRGFTYHDEKDRFVLNSFVENLIDLTDLDPANKRVKNLKLPKETEFAFRIEETVDGAKKFKSRASFVLLYDFQTDPDPKPGQFQKITRCHLAELFTVAGGAGAVGGFGGGPGAFKPGPGGKAGGSPSGMPDGKEGAPAADTEKKDGKDRSNWRPPAGTLLADAFSGAGAVYGGAEFNPMPGGKKPLPGGGFPPPGELGGGGFNPAPPTVRRAPRTEFVIHFIWLEPLPAEMLPPDQKQ